MENSGIIKQRLCSVDGCINIYVAQGFCDMHYRRARKKNLKTIQHKEKLSFSDINGIKKSLFKNRVITKNDCWEWQRAIDHGYGRVGIDGHFFRVHRVSACVFFGFNIYSELLICHKCDNRKCFNPEHLFEGTHKENTMDCIQKNRFTVLKGEQKPHSCFFDKDIPMIRNMDKSCTRQQIANKFKCCRQTIDRIINRQTYNHIP